MKTKFKLLICLIITFVFLVPSIVLADSSTHFSLKVVKCDPSTYGNLTTKANLKACYTDYKAGKLSGYVVNSGDTLAASSYLLVMLDINPVSANNIESLQTRIYFDNTIFTPLTTSTGTFLYANDTTLFPANDDGDVLWNTTMSYVPASYPDRVTAIVSDGALTSGSPTAPLTSELIGAYFGLKTSSTVPAGGQTTLSLAKTKAQGADITDADGTEYAYDATDFTINFTGGKSSDSSLGTFSVTNGSNTYTLDPSFTAGSTTVTTYNTVVPADITSINLNATANNSKAQSVIGTGTKSLITGNNQFTIAVTSEEGNVTNYLINVYKLSNDATLSNLSLSNANFNETFSGTTTTYTTTVPFATSSTTVSATANSSLATISSGTGSWSLTNSGTTLNNKAVVVQAENCKSQYSSVVGNLCTSNTYNINLTRTAASTIATLSDLKVNGTTLNSFSSGITAYDYGSVGYDVTSLNITGTVTDTGKAIITSGTGTNNINVGDNTINILVTAEDSKTTKTYTIKVHRKSNDASLKSLTVTSTPQATLSPSFGTSATNTYDYTYDATVSSVSINAVVNDTDRAYVTLKDVTNSSSTSNTINTISNTYNLTTKQVQAIVTSENGDVKTYTINLARALSNDTTLKSLTIDEGTLSPNYVSTTRKYTLTVEPDITNVNVHAVANSTYAKGIVITGNDNLAFGNGNSVEVQVTAENGDSASYFITINRKQYDIATLSDLKVGYGSDTPTTIDNFNSNTLEYTLKTNADSVPFTTTSVNIGATLTNSYATVTGTGVKSLTTGDNSFTITVTSQDGSKVNNYILHIYRHKNDDNKTNSLTIAGVTPVLVSDGLYKVTLPNSKTTLDPSDVIVSASSDVIGIVKDPALSLVTKTNNVYHYSITSESGITKTYTINITRTEDNNANISTVTLRLNSETKGTRSCTFGTDTTCTIEVPSGTSGYYLEAIIDNEASITPESDNLYSMSTSESDSIQNDTLTVTAEDGTVKTYTVTVKRTKSSDASLSDIKIDGTTITGFNKNTPSYNISLPGTTDGISISAIVNDTKATISTDLSNKFSLNYGLNTIKIDTLAEDGTTTKEYVLYVTREKNVEPDLSDITINGKSINDYLDGATFSSSKYDYTLKDFDYNTSSLLISTKSIDSTYGTSTINGSSTPITVGINTIYYSNHTSTNNYVNDITIKAMAHNTNVYHNYVLHVKRKPSDSTTIKKVEMVWDSTKHDAIWDENEQAYIITVPNSVKTASADNVVVSASDPLVPSSDNYATYTMNATNLVTDDATTGNVNNCTFNVVAEDKTTVKSYKLIITRSKSSDALLSSIKVLNPTNSSEIGSFVPSFSSTTNTYTVTVPTGTERIKIDVIKDESHAVVSGNGEYNLTSSNMTFNVISTSEDSSTTLTYTLNVVRQASSDNNLSGIVVTGSDGNNYNLKETFVAGKTSYSVDIPGTISSVNVVGNPSTSLATGVTQGISYISPDSGTNKFNIPTGSSKIIEISVTSESGSAKSYYVTVNRLKRSDTSLKTLTYTLNNGNVNSIALVDGTYDYTLPIVESSISKIYFSGATSDSEAKVTSGLGEQSVLFGSNTYKIAIQAEDSSVSKNYNITMTRKPSSNAYLKLLSVNNYSLNETFNASNNNYSLTVDETKAKLIASEITATPQDSYATVTKDSDLDLSTTSDNTYKIKVQAQDCQATYQGIDGVTCTENTYTINVTRPKSTDNTLNSLTLTGASLSPAFNADVMSYTVTIPYGKTDFTVAAVGNVSTSTITGLGAHTLSEGKVNVNVTSESGVTRTYVLNVIEAKSNDSTLASLGVTGYTFDKNFIPSTTNYSIGDISKTVGKLVVNASPSNSDAGINYYYNDTEITECKNNITCNVTTDMTTVGIKSIKVKVTSADLSSINTYVISYNTIKNNIAYLSSITTDKGELIPAFNKATYEYNISVPYETDKLNLTYIAEDSLASISINGGVGVKGTIAKEITLTAGQDTLVTARVTAENGTDYKDYKITITRGKYEGSTDATLSNLSVTGYPFTESYAPSKTEYNLGTIPFNVSQLEINATPNNGESSLTYIVNGTKQDSNVVTIPKVNGDGTISINVIAGNPSYTTTYVIKYNKNASSDAKLANLVFGSGTLTPTFNADTQKYTLTLDESTSSVNVTATLSNSGAMLNLDGVNFVSGSTKILSGIEGGTTSKKFIVTAEDGTILTYTVDIVKPVTSEQITSNAFHHKIDSNYILTVGDNTTLTNMEDQLDNDDTKLSGYKDGNLLGANDKVSTGTVIQLTVGGNVVDHKEVVILGDVNGDGIVNVTDASKVINYFLGRSTLTGAYKEAADVDISTAVNVTDASKIINHFLGRVPINYSGMRK